MPIHELKEQIGRLPEQPGVYLYFNEQGETIYVGKARALREEGSTRAAPSRSTSTSPRSRRDSSAGPVLMDDARKRNPAPQRSPFVPLGK